MLRPWQRLFASQKPRPRPVVTQRPVCSALGPPRWAASADARARPAGCRRPRGGAAAGAGQPAWWHFVTVQCPGLVPQSPPRRRCLLSGTQGRRGPGRPGACSSGPTHVAPVTLSFHETAARSPVSASRRRSGLGPPRPGAGVRDLSQSPSRAAVSRPASTCPRLHVSAFSAAGGHGLGPAGSPRAHEAGREAPTDLPTPVLVFCKEVKSTKWRKMLRKNWRWALSVRGLQEAKPRGQEPACPSAGVHQHPRVRLKCQGHSEGLKESQRPTFCGGAAGSRREAEGPWATVRSWSVVRGSQCHVQDRSGRPGP